MPAVGPLGIGVAVTLQCRPRSLVWKTRDTDPPPVPNQASPSRPATRQVPLAANANSPSSAGGMPAVGSTRQDRPPSDVDSTRNAPFTGSDRARPCRRSANAMQS